MNQTGKTFEGILDRYFETVLEKHPVYANYTGLKSGEGKLGRADLASIAADEKLRRKTLAALEQISPRELTNEQHLDRLALRNQLLKEGEDYARGQHELSPGAADTLLNLLLHELQRGDDEPARAAKNIRGVLRAAPKFLAEDTAVVIRPERVWLKIMQETCDSADSLFTAVAGFLGKNPSNQDVGLIDGAKKALKQYRDTVSAREPAPEGSFSVGSAILQRRVRDQVGLDYSLGEIEALALGEVERVGALLKQACQRFGKGSHAEDIVAKARAQWNPGGDLLSVYRTETNRVAQAFRNAKAVTFPEGDELQVRPVPEFMRHLFPTAAYSSPGAFEKRQRGIFWVNDLSSTKTTEAEKLKEQQQHFGLSLTAAHEAYPGHHLQFVIANQHPRKWRRLFAHAVFYEGWTLWCEQMMVDLKIDRSPWLEVQQLHDALWRCHRILVDLRLQTGRYSYAQAVKHMQKHLGFTKSRAEADVNWYTSSPAVPMSYWLGRLENARLYRRLVEGRGWKLKQFNDWLISHGTLPQSWLERYMLD
jgi:uncharacterized protein (DUF885 family)